MDIIVLMAPMQIKEHLTIGNVYDLLLCDFYSKVLRMKGNNVYMPLILNINGSSIEKLSSDFTDVDYPTLIENTIKKIIDESNALFIDFSDIVRDDRLSVDTLSKIPPPRQAKFVICPNCGSIYGSDFAIKECRRCQTRLEVETRTSLALDVNRKDIESKASTVHFIPEYAKKRLEDFVTHLPDKYTLVLERNRTYTATAYGFQLDPKYAAILSMVDYCDKVSQYDKTICIHGDVIKKLTYFMLAFLPDNYLPKEDIMHGLVMDSNHKKARAYSLIEIEQLGVKKRELRAILLKHSIFENIILRQEGIINEQKAVVKLYVLCERLKNPRNLDYGKNGIRPLLEEQFAYFLDLVSSWRLPKAFDVANSLLHECWKCVKNDKLSIDELNLINQIQSLYFG